MKNGTYDPDKLRKNLAIKASIEFGKEIRDKIPDIENDYRNGKSLSDIVRERHICDVLRIPSVDMAMTSVHYALRGYDGRLSFSSLHQYEGLISREELENLAREHRSKNGKIMGSLNGRINYDNGNGISSLSTDQRRNNGIKGVEAQGNTPYSMEEENAILRLSEKPEYIHQEGRSLGTPDLEKLTKMINESFHNGAEIRSTKKIRSKLYLLRKKQKKTIELLYA